jgi:hypothetical protein
LALNILLIIVAAIAVIFVLAGGFVVAVKWLLWVGLILLLLAIISWLLRSILARR